MGRRLGTSLNEGKVDWLPSFIPLKFGYFASIKRIVSLNVWKVMQVGFIDNNVGEKMISFFATKTKTQVKSSCHMLHQHIVVVHMDFCV